MSFNPVLKGDCDLLYTVTLTPPAPGAQATLHVTHKDDPPLGAQCPLLESDLPACMFCPFCVAGGTMFVNRDADCTVAVQPSTWSQVKTLFHSLRRSTADRSDPKVDGLRGRERMAFTTDPWVPSRAAGARTRGRRSARGRMPRRTPATPSR
jgi:hypothetical protein